ncbi:MAG TPA: hypothetical protein V6D25_20825 [Leptolyngbyaceae cyanobacterium]
MTEGSGLTKLTNQRQEGEIKGFFFPFTPSPSSPQSPIPNPQSPLNITYGNITFLLVWYPPSGICELGRLNL